MLFARDPAKLRPGSWPGFVRCSPLQDFDASAFELVINGIGAGDPARVASMGSAILGITSHWDDVILSGMGSGTHYVFLSSGAVYGGGFDRPVTWADTLAISVNSIGAIPPYTIAKLYSEAKHRACAELPILDLRIFGYADEAIDRSGRFFLSELAKSVADGSQFETSALDMTRDYAGCRELADLIIAWRVSGAPNFTADLYTTAPVTKNELLDVASTLFGIDVNRSNAANFRAPTAAKTVYASANHAAETLGYTPKRSALTIVLEMLRAISAGR